MKLSVSLPEEDVALVDEYARTSGLGSRSAVIRKALEALRSPELADAYVDAWQEWQDSGDAALWESTAGDGLSDAAGRAAR